MSEQRNMAGVLFKNDRKQKDTHPDYTGKAMVHGQMFFMDAWLKDGKNGKFMSFAFKPMEKRDDEARDLRDPEDRIPF